MVQTIRIQEYMLKSRGVEIVDQTSAAFKNEDMYAFVHVASSLSVNECAFLESIFNVTQDKELHLTIRKLLHNITWSKANVLNSFNLLIILNIKKTSATFMGEIYFYSTRDLFL